MGNYNGWHTYGVSRGGPSDPTSATTVTTSFQVFACTVDETNHIGSSTFPKHCILMGVEIELNGVTAASGTAITMYVSRDSAGDVPLTPSTTSGAAQEISFGKTTSTEGGVIFPIEVDYHFFSETDTADNIYVCVKSDHSSGVVKLKHIRVNWRS